MIQDIKKEFYRKFGVKVDVLSVPYTKFDASKYDLKALWEWIEAKLKEEYQKGYKQGSADTQSVVRKMIDLGKEIEKGEDNG
jgi:hypothetical protein